MTKGIKGTSLRGKSVGIAGWLSEAIYLWQFVEKLWRLLRFTRNDESDRGHAIGGKSVDYVSWLSETIYLWQFVETLWRLLRSYLPRNDNKTNIINYLLCSEII